MGVMLQAFHWDCPREDKTSRILFANESRLVEQP